MIGGAVTSQDVELTDIEKRGRKRLQREGYNITAGEITSAKIRKVQVSSERANIVYGNLNPPPWALPLINTVNTLNNNLNTLINTVNTLTNNLNTFANNLNILTVITQVGFENVKRRRYNNNIPVGQVWRPLLKEFPGLLPIGPLTPLGVVPAPAPALVPAVGAVPPVVPAGGIFPTTPEELAAFTDADILSLIEWYNDAMGILVGDATAVRRQKVQFWIVIG